MQRSVPTYEDAQLVLKLYELRREEKLRAAREWFVTNFSPASIEDVKAVSASTGPENAYYRMVTSYWDMAASLVVRGVLNVDLLLDSAGEMILIWTKLEALVPTIRETMTAPNFLVNVEKLIAGSANAQERVRLFRQRLAAQRQRAAAGAGKP